MFVKIMRNISTANRMLGEISLVRNSSRFADFKRFFREVVKSSIVNALTMLASIDSANNPRRINATILPAFFMFFLIVGSI